MLRSQFLRRVLKALFCIKIALKLSYCCKKMQNFRALGALPPKPRASGGWKLHSKTSPPPLRISGYAPCLRSMTTRHLAARACERLVLAGPQKSAIKEHIRACAICREEKYTVNSFQILKSCHTE